jgi:AraC-like DNA-binding protein
MTGMRRKTAVRVGENLGRLRVKTWDVPAVRLQGARRPMVNPNSTRITYTVGYESASQFSREYAHVWFTALP